MPSVEQQKKYRLIHCAIIVISLITSSWLLGQIRAAYARTIDVQDPNALFLLVTTLMLNIFTCAMLGYFAGRHISRIWNKPFDGPKE